MLSIQLLNLVKYLKASHPLSLSSRLAVCRLMMKSHGKRNGVGLAHLRNLNWMTRRHPRHVVDANVVANVSGASNHPVVLVNHASKFQLTVELNTLSQFSLSVFCAFHNTLAGAFS
jgi:hypothetical protein